MQRLSQSLSSVFSLENEATKAAIRASAQAILSQLIQQQLGTQLAQLQTTVRNLVVEYENLPQMIAKLSVVIMSSLDVKVYLQRKAAAEAIIVSALSQSSNLFDTPHSRITVFGQSIMCDSLSKKGLAISFNPLTNTATLHFPAELFLSAELLSTRIRFAMVANQQTALINFDHKEELNIDAMMKVLPQNEARKVRLYARVLQQACRGSVKGFIPLICSAILFNTYVPAVSNENTAVSNDVPAKRARSYHFD